mmetsp:Transcript_18112/g.31751  ORF Transcript_18112/g.31751 Transcript_18112/m.31751 type:complete len:204 (-) Transcript_18112:521-1132(-)
MGLSKVISRIQPSMPSMAPLAGFFCRTDGRLQEACVGQSTQDVATAPGVLLPMHAPELQVQPSTAAAQAQAVVFVLQISFWLGAQHFLCHPQAAQETPGFGVDWHVPEAGIHSQFGRDAHMQGLEPARLHPDTWLGSKPLVFSGSQAKPYEEPSQVKSSAAEVVVVEGPSSHVFDVVRVITLLLQAISAINSPQPLLSRFRVG